ncbi:hypothetical protein KDW82_08340 [Burkholderia vietnamiensis]|uniref:hypothetical protein n=1 Tax=Burkholderia vietnamiensis TaxID=60552 RepID=UPI001B942C5E|nr:hypothetical protein [Burkholderia vietnamiensis]MBR8189066.1 hypothetical protein [Burkholderia vietnamiensis]
MLVYTIHYRNPGVHTVSAVIGQLDRVQWQAARRLVKTREGGRSSALPATVCDAVRSAVDVHVAGCFPLSHFYGLYSQRQWSRGLSWLRAYPAYQALEGAARRWESDMRVLLGARYDALFVGRGPGSLECPVESVRNLPNCYASEFGEHARDPRSPDTLASIYSRFDANIVFHRERLTVLRDIRIYDPTFDPDRKVRLLGRHASATLEPLLRDIHGLKLPGGFRSPTVSEIVDGRFTVAELLQRRDDQARAHASARHAADLEVRTWIGLALDLFESVSTRHLATINRLLKDRSRGKLAITRYLPGGPELCLNIRDLRLITSHAYQAKATDLSLLVSYLDLLYDELTSLVHDDSSCYWAASNRADARFSTFLSTLSQ